MGKFIRIGGRAQATRRAAAAMQRARAGEKVGLGYKRHSSDKRKALTGVQPRPVFARMPLYDTTILPQRVGAVVGYAMQIKGLARMLSPSCFKSLKGFKEGTDDGQHFWANV